MTAIRKEDVIVCAYDENTPIGEGASKLSEINLDNYKPYFVIDRMSDDEINENFNYGICPDWLEKNASDNLLSWLLPAANAVKFLWEPTYCITEMEGYATYPDVSTLEYTIEPVKNGSSVYILTINNVFVLDFSLTKEKL